MADVVGDMTRRDTSLDELLIGLGMAQLLIYGDEWIWRRIESFTFTEVEIIRRQMSIDFQAPREAGESDSLDASLIQELDGLMKPPLLPVLTLEKRKLTKFDMWDEDGRTLPMLTTGQNGRLAGSALVALATVVARLYGWRELEPEFERALRGVAMLPPPFAELLLDCLVDWPSAHEGSVERYAPLDESPDRRKPAEKSFYELIELVRALEWGGRRHRHRTLMADPTLQALARKLATDFVVFAPVVSPVTDRHVYKLAYEEQLARPGERGAERRARRLWRWAAERCAWVPKTYGLGRIDVGQEQSHHLEIATPDGTVIFDALFQAVFPREPRADAPARDDEEEAYEARSDVSDRHDSRRVHLHLRDLPAQADATAALRVQPDSAGALNAGLVIAIVVVAIFWIGRGHLDDIRAQDAATALLIAVPSVFAFYIARLDEHALVQHLLSGVRFFVYLSAALAFVAAGAIAFGYESEEMKELWTVLRFAGLVPVAGLGFSWLQLRLRRPRSDSGPARM